MEFLINVAIDSVFPLSMLVVVWFFYLVCKVFGKNKKRDLKKAKEVLWKISALYFIGVLFLSATTSSNTYKNTTGYDRSQDVYVIQKEERKQDPVTEITDKTLKGKSEEDREEDFKLMLEYK